MDKEYAHPPVAPERHPYPLPFAAPANPVGRDRELDQLRVALDAAAGGERRVVLVAGHAGVGKSALIGQLRPLADARGGRFVLGKFDQHNERETAAVVQALSALGRLLLIECGDEERAQVRGKILRVLGAQAGLARVVPEFALLLADVPEPRAVDPAHAAARMAEVVVGLLRAVASPARPLVLVLDDLQWSGSLSTRLIDAVLAAPDLAGLLLVAAYRDDELPPEHPMVAAIARWAEEHNGPELLAVANLQPQQVAKLLSGLLGLPDSPAGPGMRLTRALAPHSRGNPYETVELVSSLREEGMLAPNLNWDEHAVRQHLACTRVEDVLAARIARLPTAARELVQVLACMGTTTSREVARSAVAQVPGEFEASLAELFKRGFLVRESWSDGMLRMRHDRVQQAAYASLPPSHRGAFQLVLARRLARCDGLAWMAADQYLCAVHEVQDAAERRYAGNLLRQTAAQARLIGNHLAAYRMLKAALLLLEAVQQTDGEDIAALAACEIEYHLALFCVGRLEEADAIYARVEARKPAALDLVDSACEQVISLMNRDRMDEAVALGTRVLRELGLPVPQDLAGMNFPRSLASIRRWVEAFDLDRESARAEASLPSVVAAAKMINKLTWVTVFTDLNLLAWLIFKSQELWEEHGPCASLLVSIAQAGMATIQLGQDWRTGYLAARQAVDLCEMRGWEPEASQARYMFALIGIHWFEPLERRLSEMERAREGLLAGGDLRNASFSCRVSAVCLLECGPTLRRYSEELAMTAAIAHRAGNTQVVARCLADAQLLGTLQDEGAYAAVFDEFDAQELLNSGVSPNPWVVWSDAYGRTMINAIFADGSRLARGARRAMAVAHSTKVSFESLYGHVWVHWLLGLAAAWELQGSAGACVALEREPMAELDASIEWLRQRAIDAPFNFRHMHLHLLAERAWAVTERQAAALLFDQTLAATEQSGRPWHQALITERAARLHLAQGWDYSGSRLLVEAQQLYAAWGATAKVAQLRAQTGVPAQGVTSSARPLPAGRTQMPDDMDALAVQRASQALGSEKNPARLKLRVEEVLGSMTGATRVVLAVRDEEADHWVLQGEDRADDDAALPLTAFRYVERTREPLLLADAVADDRFSRDIYFKGMERCSLLVVPIQQQQTLQAMLVLENRSSRGAFSAVRLDTVTMIAGQLAVSLESASLYERLERKVREQTQQLRETQSRLVDEARRAGMAQIAVNVLHNVGNVLTSVNVSAHMLTAQVTQSRATRVGDLAVLLDGTAQERDRLFGEGGKGRLLPAYVRQLAGVLASERDQLLEELGRLSASVDHIKNVVAVQQSYAGASGLLESCTITQLVDDALRIQQESLESELVQVVRDYQEAEPAPLDRTRVMQILVNLIANARHAMQAQTGDKRLQLTVRHDKQGISVSVRDNGCGIAEERLEKIFAHGYTTKAGGHGFGLHSCAAAAKEMGGMLGVHSDGPGQGATFTLGLRFG